MFAISKDSPVYYLTSVANDRLPIFQKDKLKQLTCKALDEARASAQRRPLEDEPLLMDLDKLKWHKK